MANRATVFIGLGSNAPDADQRLRQAVAALAALEDASLCAVSPVYQTEPQGYPDQPWFANQVVKMTVAPRWAAPIFLDSLLALEKKMGRQRSPDPALRYGPRVIDLDLLLFGNIVSRMGKCLLPHPRITRRAFVLVPLKDLDPNVVVEGNSPAAWLSRLDWRLEGNRIFQKS